MKGESVKTKTYMFLMIIMILISYIETYPQEENKIQKTFEEIKLVRLNTSGGNCLLEKNHGNNVKVIHNHSYSKTHFEPQFFKEGNQLILKEKVKISGSGDSHWRISIPDETAFQFQTLSGNLKIEGMSSNISAKTVTGDINASHCQGEIELISVDGDLNVESLSGDIRLKTNASDLETKKLSGNISIRSATGDLLCKQLEGKIDIKCPAGDIELYDSKGSFNITTASGNILAQGIIIENQSYFKTATGKVEIILAKSPEYNITVRSVTGHAILNFNENPIEGTYEFKAINDVGKLISPFPFEKEEEMSKGGRRYSLKSFSRELKTPKFEIFTDSGTAELREK